MTAPAPEQASTKLRDAIILAIVAALGAGGGGGLSLLRPEKDTSSIEIKVDVLWEAEKARVARQLGEMR